jgi:hypothetical protein
VLGTQDPGRGGKIHPVSGTQEHGLFSVNVTDPKL